MWGTISLQIKEEQPRKCDPYCLILPMTELYLIRKIRSEQQPKDFRKNILYFEQHI